MEKPLPGQYWKTPFVWEPGCPAPQPAKHLRFEIAPADWLSGAVARALSSSIDESVAHAVAKLGAAEAATQLLASAPAHFEYRPQWWQLALDGAGNRVGFVLPVLFGGER